MSTERSTSPARRCTAKTVAGKRCKARPLKGVATCIAHTRNHEVSRGFGGPQPGSGRPRKPKVTEQMLVRVDELVEEIVQIYTDAFDAVVVAKYEGEVHVSDVADHAARIAAAEALLNRVHGKPRQEVELAASETGAPLSIVAVDDRKVSDAAHEFLRRLLPDT